MRGDGTPRGGCGCASRSRPASGRLSGGSRSRGKSRSKPAGGTFPRAPTSSTSCSDSRRRAAKASASSEARSSHCASSAATSSGPSSDSTESRVSTAIPVSSASGGTGFSEIAKAPRSASACRAGSPATRSSTGRSSWCSPANARSRSDSRPTAANTRIPADLASPAASASRTVLPTPGSPRSSSTRLSAYGEATSSLSRDSSSPRPTRLVSLPVIMTLEEPRSRIRHPRRETPARLHRPPGHPLNRAAVPRARAASSRVAAAARAAAAAVGSWSIRADCPLPS